MDTFISLYTEAVRLNIFSALLTLAAFLFSLKTFIIVKLKEDVYDSPSYDTMVKQLAEISPNIKKESKYKNLENFSNMLYWTVVVCFVTSIINLITVFSYSFINLLLALIATLASIICFSLSLYFYKININLYFKHLRLSTIA